MEDAFDATERVFAPPRLRSGIISLAQSGVAVGNDDDEMLLL